MRLYKLSVACIALLLICAFLSCSLKDDKLESTISGSQAQMVKKFYPDVPAGAVGGDIADEIYKLSVQHPEVKTLKVHFLVDKAGLVDKYGNPATKDLDLGWKSYSTDPEAKKYVSELRWLSTTNEDNIIGGMLCGDPYFGRWLDCK